MFGQMKQLMEAKAKIDKVQKELKNIRVEESSLNEKIKIVANGLGEIIEIKIDPSALGEDIKKIEKALTSSINNVQKKARDLSAKKLQELLKDLPPELRSQLGI